MVISGINRDASITIDGNNVQYVDHRDKYGQGRVSCCSPISKDSSWYCQGERIYFIPLLTMPVNKFIIIMIIIEIKIIKSKINKKLK